MLDEIVRQSSLAEEFFDEGMRESIRLFLETRFGTVEPDLLAAIGAADTEQLRALVKLSASATLQGIRAHLGLK